jgi:hypothetical protein
VTTASSSTSVATLAPLDAGRLCLRIPDGVSVQITRTGSWAPGEGLGLETIRPLQQVTSGSDGTVTTTVGGDAAWVSVEPTATSRVVARRCSTPATTSKKVTWFSDPDVDELQLVPLTTVDGLQRWCAQRAAAAVTHVARFVADAGAGLTTSLRRVTPSAAVGLPDGTRAVAAQVHARRGEVTVSVCSNGDVVASRIVRPSPQVSTVLLDVPARATSDLTVCVVASPKDRVHLLGLFTDDGSSSLTVSVPRRVASVRG